MNKTKSRSLHSSNGDGGADLEKRPTMLSTYKDIIVNKIREVPDPAAIATANIANTPITEEDGKRILRKIDLNIMPLLCVVYAIQFLDKTSLSYASIMGLREDNNITLAEYSWLSSIFYIAYLVGEWPTNYALQRLPLAKWTSLNVIVWGGILACTGATKDFKGMMVVRFFLGLLESTVTPSFSLVTSQYYRKSEQGTRTGIWFSCNALSQIVGSILAWGLATADGKNRFAIPGWKVLFILLGTLTMALGVLLWILLPDSPLEAWFLSEEERIMAVERIRSNNMGIGNKTWKRYQFIEALTDPLTWLYCFAALALTIPNGGFTNFFSILIRDMGYDKYMSLLYSAPAGAVLCVSMIFLMWLGDKTRARLACGIAGACIGMMGVLLLWQLPSSNTIGRLMGYYFNGVAIVAFTTLLSLISSNVAGSTKKSTVTAMFFISYCVGNLIGPQTFRAQDAPRYTTALIVATSAISFGILCMLTIWWINVRENKRKEAICAAPDYVPQPNQEFLDLTDRENPAFRYTS